jgi:hypothetical protein
MNEPKRHHWWPQLQSQYWTNEDGHIFVTRSDGSYFTPNPNNIGVENELYVRFGPAGEKDYEIERWFSREIETPFAQILDDLANLKNLQRDVFRADPDKARVVEALGYITLPYLEYTVIPQSVRQVVADYVAALLVRNPNYLMKMREFHLKENSPNSETQANTMALNNMLHVFRTYREVIRQSEFIFVKREGHHEFLFSDTGIATEEPWRKGGLPFDIHFPLTPDLALEVLPVPQPQTLNRIHVMRSRNEGIGRLNRIALATAKRFVFSRSRPIPEYIKKYFGVPAPKPYGFRYRNGRVETKYDATRDR